MRAPALMRSVLTHGVALLSGLACAMFPAKPSGGTDGAGPGGRGAQSRSETRPAGGWRPSSSTAFRRTYEELTTRPMTAAERETLRERLLYEWGEHNPAGLLAFLESKRVWPYGYDFGIMSSNWNLESGNLTRDRPDLVLDFAIRNGCRRALDLMGRATGVGGNHDPHKVIGSIESLPPASRGPAITRLAEDLSQQMGRHGVAMTNPNDSYLQGVAEAQLYDQGRLDDFFGTFEKIGDASARKSLAHSLGYSLAAEKPGDQVLARILRLPPDYREVAVKGMFLPSGGAALRFSEIREERRQWIGKLVEHGLADGAKEGVDDLCNVRDHPSAQRELATWVASFPSDDSWKPIAREVCRSWIYRDRNAMVREVCAMPDGAARDMLAAHAAAARPMSGPRLEQSTIERLLELISDPEIRKRFNNSADPSTSPGPAATRP